MNTGAGTISQKSLDALCIDAGSCSPSCLWWLMSGMLNLQEQSSRYGKLQNRGKRPPRSKGAIWTSLPGSEVAEAGVLRTQTPPAAGTTRQALGGEPGGAGYAVTSSAMRPIPHGCFSLDHHSLGMLDAFSSGRQWGALKSLWVWGPPGHCLVDFSASPAPYELCSFPGVASTNDCIWLAWNNRNLFSGQKSEIKVLAGPSF